ncbi:ABC transporter permease [Anaerolineales bacterium]
MIWLAVTLAFFMLYTVPTMAFSAIYHEASVSDGFVNQRMEALGYQRPILIQYADYLIHLLRFDLGQSLYSGQPVLTTLLQRLPVTLTLTGSGMIVATILGILSGLCVFTRKGLLWTKFYITISLSVPLYWSATLIIILLSQLHYPYLNSWILPIALIGLHTSGAIASVLQSAILETKNADFVRTARGKGLGELQIFLRHILPLAIIPVINVIALQIGFLFTGTVFTEMIFLKAGLGSLAIDATTKQDYPLVMGVVLVSALIYSLSNFFSTTLIAILDPRISR